MYIAYNQQAVGGVSVQHLFFYPQHWRNYVLSLQIHLQCSEANEHMLPGLFCVNKQSFYTFMWDISCQYL